ncbi:hypothetical protein CRENBAI_023404 [Crenichthys baileyi]|uniref:Uncharacterized protein n=1 Tax=Crenichthys baileyi TaxID=28760 RepID=A0AAV9RHZ0_9TELE
MPGFPEDKSENDLEVERATVVNEMKKIKIDWKLVDKMMDNTYSLRRKKIGKDAPLVTQVQERWPALFFVPQIESEFAHLTSVNLKEAFFSGLDQYLNRFLELFKAKSEKPERTKLTRTLDNSTHTKRTILLLGLPHYLRDDALAKTVEVLVHFIAWNH